MPSAELIEVPPVWLQRKKRWRVRIPGRLRDWLLDPSSLTDQMKRSCVGGFSVRVLGESWEKPRLDEARALGLRSGQLGRVRQVHLLCNGRPRVFARTVIPFTTLSGAQRRLGYLGSKPLGAFLFADPGMQRGEVELACIRPGQAMFAQAVAGLRERPDNIWGRRSLFRVGGKPLLVSELFLPGLPELKP